jgi:hypothetical protein
VGYPYLQKKNSFVSLQNDITWENHYRDRDINCKTLCRW